MTRKGKMKHRMHTNPFNYRHALPLIDQQELFGREAPIALDVGCGPGAFTAELAKKHPEWNCIGNEIRRHYVELTEEKREGGKVPNLRGLFANANLQLPGMLPDDSVVFFSHNFPDPWFKKRHEKRRVLNLKFLYDMRPKFKDGCELHVMTDYQPIGESMRKALMNCSFLRPLHGNHDFIKESTTGIFSEREIVHQEKRGENIWRMAYVYDASLPVVEPAPELMGNKKAKKEGEAVGDEESESDDSEDEEDEAGPSTSNGKRAREDASPEAATSKKVQLDSITLTSPADFHVHLRQGEMSELIAPHVAQGGISLAYVMPNLVPPITTNEAAVAYHSSLKAIAPETDFWMTLYLNPSLTPEEIEKAAKGGVVKGVKSYPRGVTTNSEGGIESYEAYYPVFEAMQKHGLVLNLHGEVPSDAEKNITILNAESEFLSHLIKIHTAFPTLRIVLEHATTRAAVSAVKSCGPTVACTITPHHLELIVDDWAGKPLHYCKPVAKWPDDRKALREVIKEGHPRFFLGSDSAPHPLASKYPAAATSEGGAAGLAVSCGCAAGVYTSVVLVPLCAHLLESFGALERLEDFVSTFGRNFYGAPAGADAKKVTLVRNVGEGKGKGVGEVPKVCVHKKHVGLHDSDKGKLQVIPFWAGKKLAWRLE